jgi:hypothetical protein
MADKNIVMASADEIRATGLFSEDQIQAAERGDGYVGEASVEKVGVVKYHITMRRSAVLPSQFGDHDKNADY